MLYADQDEIDRLRRADPHGITPTNRFERAALISKLLRAVWGVKDETMRDILETIVTLL